MKRGSTVTDTSHHLLIRERIGTEAKRPDTEAGIAESRFAHFARPAEHAFTADQRDHTTILFGGLTWKHELLIKGALECLGHRCEILPTPDTNAYQIGKEYGNNGQCNPTYFTVGNLIQYLQNLEKEGLSRKEIIENYVFVTAGSCGPCRFGMYEAEYRLALRNSGFEDFRVLLFQQTEGLDQAEAEAGLKMNLDFFLGLLNAMMMGDIINEFSYQIRPFEVNKGETDKVLKESTDYLYEVFKRKKQHQFGNVTGKLLNAVGLIDSAEQVWKIFAHIFGNEYTQPMQRVADMFSTIEIDPFRVKPIVKITGEFWAQTTEGDGNFNMFKFLEREGAEVLTEAVATWIDYLLHQAKQAAHDRRGLGGKEEHAPKKWELKKRLFYNANFKKKELVLTVAEKLVRREYKRFVDAIGGTCGELVDQYELQKLAHPFFNSRCDGGEGHLEIAKNIYCNNNHLAHMVLSLKPFGCMPSTQSDGAQAAVVSQYKDIIFLPIETSGEGEINAHSRVQMALGEAKVKAKSEFKKVLEETGFTMEALRDYIDKHPEMKRANYNVPHYNGITGRAARLVKHVADRIETEAIQNK
jgi:predicted nucleotide-binding protein (sugar kinase/HSP70/actin superfamily)